MSILSALKQQNSSIDDLAKLPQAMIMQMAQKKQISEDMLAPILARKAEMMDAVARSKSLQQPTGQPSVMEQVMAKNIQAENPANAMPQAMPQAPEEVGVGQIPVPERQYAGGGIIAFARGDLVDLDEEDDDNDILAEYAQAMAEGERAADNVGIPSTMPKSGNAGMGIRHQGGAHQYEDLVTAKAKEFGVDPRLASYILNKETGGMKNPENARSSAGAMGIAQFMPATARQYGINPDIPEQAAVGMGKHLRYLMDKYEDPKLAAIAYNWGEGNTNKWLNAGADMSKLPKETQKYVAQLAQGGEVRHFDLGGDIDTTGAELDALRSGSKTLEEKLRSIGSRGTGRDELQIAYDNALKLRKEKELQYEALMNQAGVNKPSFFPQSSLSTERPAPNPIVQRESSGNITPPKVVVPVAAAPADAKKPSVPVAPVSTSPSNQDFRDFDQAQALFEAENRGNVKRAESQAPKGRFESFLDEVAQDRKSLAAQREQDKNMALLAAGLGMLGGTSQYAFENIGKGGLSGVQYLSEANKQRAAEKMGLDKSQVAALRYQDLADIAKGGRESTLGIRQAELSRKIRDDNMEAINRLEKNSLAKATAALKSQGLLGTDLNDPQTQQMLNDWIQRDLANNKAYNKLYQDTFGFAYDVAPQTSGGSNVIKLDKKGNPIK